MEVTLHDSRNADKAHAGTSAVSGGILLPPMDCTFFGVGWSGLSSANYAVPDIFCACRGLGRKIEKIERGVVVKEKDSKG